MADDGAPAIDLVVAGSGAAGLTGALVASIGGARVVVLEKSGLVGGTTAMSGGGAWIPCNPHMADVGVDDSRDDALTYLRACVSDTAEPAHLEALVDEGREMIALLEAEGGMRFQAWPAVGATIDYRPWLPGSRRGGRNLESLSISMSELGEWAARVRKEPRLRSATNLLGYYTDRQHLSPPREAPPAPPGDDVDTYWRGTALVGNLLRSCLERGVDVRTETRATALLVGEGRVVGLRAEQGGRSIELRAPHVLLATGGFTHSEELKRLWLTKPIDYTCDVSSNEGDGHLMGMEAGAQLAGIGDAWWMPHTPIGEVEGVVNAAGTREDRALPHTLMVNSSAKRFMNEAVNYYDAGEAFGNKAGAAPRNFPAWLVFDQQGVERYAILAWKVPRGEVPEWFHRADSLDDLARSIGVDGTTFVATIERFNGFARSGRDDDFGRGDNLWDQSLSDPDHLPNPSLGTIEKPPFYAVPMYAGAIATRGGLRVDATARVLSVRGVPIQGLYAAGNCSSASASGAYAGPGSTIGAAMTFGYLAARQVVESLAAGPS
jgi:3-oxosteroid 1-dehydrogenase